MRTIPDLVFYATAKGATIPHGIDEVVLDAHGVQRTRLLGDTLEQVRARYPNAGICTIDELIEKQEAGYRTSPEMTTREAFIDALEILPPKAWQNLGTVEVFKMSEHLSGRMTRIYARIKDTYWTFIDRHDIPLQDVMAKIEAKLREMVLA